MGRKLTLEEFKQKYYEKFPDSKVEILKEICQNRILIKNKYGICDTKKCHLLNGNNPTIQSALNKNEYFANKAREVHGDKYDYSLVEYKGKDLYIIIKCKNCLNIFNQTPACHINSRSGCISCSLKHNKENPNGWSKLEWKNKSEKSKYFDSFKVYIIECWDENERFYKIGRTYRNINNRFSSNKEMPYKYKILKIFKGLSEEIYDLEKELKNKNKEYKYIPTKKFNGMYECFSQLKQIN